MDKLLRMNKRSPNLVSVRKMNVAASALALALLFTQTVTFSNCCQGMLCPQKDACPPCDEGSRTGGLKNSSVTLTADRDCCGERGSEPSDSGHGSTCFHLEPSGDVEQAPLPGLTAPDSTHLESLFGILIENPLQGSFCRPVPFARPPDLLRDGHAPRALHLPLLI